MDAVERLGLPSVAVKRKQQKHKLRAGGKGSAPDAATAEDQSVRLSRRKRIWFRSITLLFVPVMLLVSAEALLRLVGYGDSMSFFVPGLVEGKKVWLENGRFGARFFPAELVRRPPPLVMRANKPPGVIRIFLFGESAALGDPHPAYGMGRYLEVLLGNRFPGTEFEVVCVAMTAINSHAILPIARECVRHDGDIWLLYMGNNEMVGPFGAATVFGAKAPPRVLITATLAMRSTRLGQWLTALSRRLAPSPYASWGGMEMFLENQVEPEDLSRTVVHDHFRSNIEALVRTALKARVGLVMSSVASNLKDCPPFASVHGHQVIGQLETTWQQHYAAGQQHQMNRAWGNALQSYAASEAIDSLYADLAYRQARCWLESGEIAQARQKFEHARDLDALPFRADSAINEALREVALAHADQGVRWVDAVEVLGGPERIPGEETFYEHVHLNFAGNYRMARAFGEEIHALLPETIQRGATADWAGRDFCERELGLTDWNRDAVAAELRARLSQPPFVNQAGHETRLAKLEAEQAAVRARLTREAATEAREIYQAALRKRPSDHRLYANYAEFLAAIGDVNEAVNQWRRVELLLPHHHVAPFFLGKLLSRQGAYDEAVKWLQICLDRQPGAVDAFIELGHLELRRKRPTDAIEHYRSALARQPGNGSLYLDLAEAHAAAGDRKAAMDSLRRAIALRSTLWRAHYYLGVELAQNEQIQEAEVAFGEAVRLNPTFALAHLNLGVALIRQGRIDEAVERFEATLQLDPDNAKARDYLEMLRSRKPSVMPE